MKFPGLFRLVFVSFFLYIIGDAFYRWDAFDYYGSLFEFLPGFALISVLWCFLSLLTTIFIWLMLRVSERLLKIMKFRVTFEHLLVFIFLFVSLGLASWYFKTSIWTLVRLLPQIKACIVIGIAGTALLLTFMLRNKTDRLIETINERITPLVWLFGSIVILSVPFLAYLALGNQPEKKLSNEIVSNMTADRERPNIILITFDALTAHDMSVYGYSKETTPFISSWARSATVFSKHKAASNYTAPATATLMTGKRVWSHRRFQAEGGKPENGAIENLPILLKNSGYFNMAFIANHIASVQELDMFDSFMVAPPSYEFMSPSSFLGLLLKHLQRLFGNIKGFDWILKEDFILYMLVPDNYFKYPYKNQFPVKNVTDRFIAEVKNNSRQPYFAWIHLYPPHLPYLPTEEYAGRFDPSLKYRTAESQDNLVRSRFFLKKQQADADSLRNRYDEFVSYCDAEFRYFIEQLEKEDYLENTIIILSSDHGESFEHGYFTHGGPSLFEEMTHIPLIIKEPGQKEGQIIDDLVDQADVPATILDLSGIPEPPWMEGRSLVPFLRREKLQQEPVFSMTFIEAPAAAKIKTGTIAVWEGDYKLMHYIAKNKSVLFNLKEDPGENNDLFSGEPEAGKRLLSIIQKELGKINKRFGSQ